MASQSPYVIHIGTNDLGTDQTPDEICSEILRLVKELKTDKNKIQILLQGATLIIQKLKK